MFLVRRSCYDPAMRILVASFITSIAIVGACGSAPKKEGSIVTEGSDTAPTCCCKTIPVTDDKEIVPKYAMAGRMECSTENGTCVDDVQCNGSQQTEGPGNTNNVPPPPTLGPSTDPTTAPIQ
jgi:hypothetical protein